MATLIIKNNTALDQDIDDRGTFVPASGDITLTEPESLVWFSGSVSLRAKVSNGTFTINDGTSDLSAFDGRAYLTDLYTQAGFDDLPSLDPYQLQIGGQLDAATLPLANCGTEIVRAPRRFLSMRGRRGTPGSSGTTTVQLELNGTPIGGATLSWTNADAAFELKTVSISLLVAIGDRVSIRLTSAEVGGEDVFVEVN
jgi:hypothetical protein